jgi:hypothetical protein
VGSLDLPDKPDEAGPAMQVDAGGTDRPTPKSRELPGPDERARAYEAARAHVSAETSAEPSPGREPDAGGQRTYKDQAPRFDSMWADHDRSWPERPHAATERSGGRPELPAATAEAVGPMRVAERTLSANGQAIVPEHNSSGWLEASESRPDGDDRLEEKSSAETVKEASPSRGPDETGQPSYWDELPRFRGIWADHEQRWPERQSVAESDGSSDPPGTYRSKGGLKLKPEEHVEADEAIRRVRETEQPISEDMQTIGRENAHCGWLEGFKHRIKGDDRLKEKIAEQRGAESDESAAEVLRRIPDALRYTYCFERYNYFGGYYDIKARLESFGYEMSYLENYWTNAEYKGINTRWVTQQGQRFEVQFHTPESFHAKHDLTHIAYERIRDTTTSRAEKRELHEFQRQVCALIEVPESATDIPNYRKEGRALGARHDHLLRDHRRGPDNR